MGTVYEATQTSIGARVAIKVLDTQRLSHPSGIDRFVQEARLAGQLKHPNIIQVFSFNRLPDGSPYYVMEHLTGVSLSQRLRRGPLELEEVLDVLEGIAAALDAAHAQGIVHRDLKPANVMLTEVARRGEVHLQPKLLDFGVAKLLDGDAETPTLTSTQQTPGTPAYMAPEQCRAAQLDHRADLYALGVVAYELLTGRRPFLERELGALLWAQQMSPPPLPSSLRPAFGPPLDRVLLRALAKEPQDRFATAAEFVTALAAALPASQGRPATEAQRPRPWRLARNRPRVAILALSLGLVIGLALALRALVETRVAPSPSTNTRPAVRTNNVGVPATTPVATPVAPDRGAPPSASSAPADASPPAPDARRSRPVSRPRRVRRQPPPAHPGDPNAPVRFK